MSFDEITYEVSEYIATITLNRPDKLNAWTFKMEAEYKRAMADAEQRDDVRVIIVTGAGRGFCAGADMSLLNSVMGGDVDTSDVQTDLPLPGAGPDTPEDFQKQYSFPPAIGKPIIAAINGHAMGIGLVHTLFCDFRIASDKAKFGIENAMDLLYTARIIEADEALRIGLVSRVVPQEEFMQAVRKFATQLATQSSPRSLRVMKRQIWHGLFNRLGPSVDLAANEMMESFGCDDFREGVLSFMEKRAPQFTGK
jgi:enoyl-CoA hydratase/carnithine racemase